MEASGQFHVPAVLLPGQSVRGTRWIGGWDGMDAVVKRSLFPLPGIETGLLDRPARSLSLYRLPSSTGRLRWGTR
jgi:hypothetical protein